jgi:hypothetical protein
LEAVHDKGGSILPRAAEANLFLCANCVGRISGVAMMEQAIEQGTIAGSLDQQCLDGGHSFEACNDSKVLNNKYLFTYCKILHQRVILKHPKGLREQV